MFSQIVDFPTRFPDNDAYSSLDLCLVSDPGSCKASWEFPHLGNSDHAVVSITLQLKSGQVTFRNFLRNALGLKFLLFPLIVVLLRSLSGYKLVLILLCLIVNTRLDLIPRLGSHLLVLLQSPIETTFSICFVVKNLLKIRDILLMLIVIANESCRTPRKITKNS